MSNTKYSAISINPGAILRGAGHEIPPVYPSSPSIIYPLAKRTRKVDKDYRTYERTIDDMKARESEMAATFVQKVSNREAAGGGGGAY